MTQTIKPNDLVYIPSETNTLQKVIHDGSNLVTDDGYNCFTIDEQGYKYDFDLASWGTRPFAFLATPEMKEKLEQVYGKLEDIPVDEEFIAFDAKLAKLQSMLHKYYTQNRHDLANEMETTHQELLQMFKERGSK